MATALTIENIRENTDVPFDWLLYAFKIVKMTDEEIEAWVDHAVQAGIRKIRTQFGRFAWQEGKMDRILAFYKAFEKYRVDSFANNIPDRPQKRSVGDRFFYHKYFGATTEPSDRLQTDYPVPESVDRETSPSRQFALSAGMPLFHPSPSEISAHCSDVPPKEMLFNLRQPSKPWLPIEVTVEGTVISINPTQSENA